ncbi:hypothetical protein XENOCAPTIV_022174, partial [Xenoophorus captivus]
LPFLLSLYLSCSSHLLQQMDNNSGKRRFLNGGSSPSQRPNLNMTINQQRIFSLEPFHQSSIISSRQKRGRDDEGEDEGTTGRPNKKVKPTNDLKKLKVRIELNGLRLNKPRLPGELGQWRPSGEKAADMDRKFSPVRERSEVNGSWSESRFLRRDGPKGSSLTPFAGFRTSQPRSCCMSSHLQEVVLYCLERQLCDVNHRDNAGYCALHEACARGWLGIVRLLIAHGADVNCSSQDGTRPLHDAVENDHVEVVRFLLACGADPTLTTYSGRGPLSMTHSAAMETFLEGLSCKDCDNQIKVTNWDVDQPKVSLEGLVDPLRFPPVRIHPELQGWTCSDGSLMPRNWLLLADVLGRLRMTSRSFRRLFPQLNIQSVPEDEFYRQASLSQLLTGPDEQELASFRPDVKDPLELVEATPELAGMLGSSLEFVNSRWDSLDVSPPSTPSPGPPPCPTQSLPAGPQEEDMSPESRTVKSISGPQHSGCFPPSVKLDSSLWGQQKDEAPTSAKPGLTLTTSWWEPQRPLNPGTNGPGNPDSKKGEQQSRERKISGLTSMKLNSVDGGKMWEQQRLRSRNVETKVVGEEPKPVPIRNKKAGDLNPAHLKEELNSNIWKNQGSKAGTDLDCPDASALTELPLQNRRSEISSCSKLDLWHPEGSKRPGGTTTATNTCEGFSLVGNTLKLDASWQRNLTNVRVHIRDLGMKVAGLQKDIKKVSGKVVGKGSRVKTRS